MGSNTLPIRWFNFVAPTLIPSPRRAAAYRPFIVALVLGLAACDSDDSTIRANTAPETSITAQPPDLASTPTTVTFAWAGTDPDGSIDHYEWRITDNGLDGFLDLQDSLGLAWNSTEELEGSFEVSADIDSAEVGKDGRPFFQTHTFQVRAVDDDGAADATPADVSFTATTLSPTVELDRPPRAWECDEYSLHPRFSWTVHDPDGNGGPLQTRYAFSNSADIVVPGEDPIEPGTCLHLFRFVERDGLEHLPPNAWTPWTDYEPGGPGSFAELGPLDSGQGYILIVQAKDAAGAVTPTLDETENWRTFTVADELQPVLWIEDLMLGVDVHSESDQLRRHDVLEGQEFDTRWWAEAGEYAGTIDAYRYGWNVSDPTDPVDPGWEVDWGPVQRVHRTASFETQNLVVAARDKSGAVTWLTWEFNVIHQDFSPPKDVLCVADWGFGSPNLPSNLALKELWTDQWDRLISASLPSFQAPSDLTWSPGDLDLMQLIQYRAVVWFVNGGSSFSLLRERWSSPRWSSPNWLHAYQAYRGNLLLVGPSAGLGVLSVRTDPTWDPPHVLDERLEGRLCEGPPLCRENRESWPYLGWCIETLDITRNGGSRVECDFLARAEVHGDFSAVYPSSAGQLVDLLASEPRLPDPEFGVPSEDGSYKIRFEEIYDLLPSDPPIDITLRACQTPMFAYRMAKDESYPPGHEREGQRLLPDPAYCEELGFRAELNGATVGVASTAYSQNKYVLGTADYLWGFNPLAFREEDVARALSWIFREGWQIPGAE